MSLARKPSFRQRFNVHPHQDHPDDRRSIGSPCDGLDGERCGGECSGGRDTAVRHRHRDLADVI